MHHKRGLWAIKVKIGGVFLKHDPRPAPAKPVEKRPKFYPAEDVKKRIANRRKPKPTKLKASIIPGTLLILLAGRFMGKKVVFLKQLPSELILDSGPFKNNGVLLRRVPQSYVIGTSVKVDISGVDVENFEDDSFSKKDKECNKTKEEFFREERGKWSYAREEG